MMTTMQYEELLTLFRRALTAIATGGISSKEMKLVAKKALDAQEVLYKNAESLERMKPE